MISFIKKALRKTLFHDRWTCNACGKEIFDDYFCEECLNKITQIDKNICEHCGRLTAYPVKFCDSCIEVNINFDRALSVFDYKEPISFLIQNFKYKNHKYHAKYFAEKLYSLYEQEGLSADVVTLVPMHEDRMEERKYNHAEILAREFSTLSKIEVKPIIKKVKETERQATLSFKDRLKNLTSTFKADKVEVDGKRVLVIDDVLTTGATADVISKTLKKAGAKEVVILTVASVSRLQKD
jgi:ComF family protein